MRRIAAGLVAALALLSLYLFCVVPWKANEASKVFTATVKMAVEGNPTAIAFLRDGTNLATAEAWRRSARDDAELNMAVASAFALVGRPDDALRIYDEAFRFDRRPEMYFNRASVRLGTGDAAGAIEDYLYAVRFNPTLLKRIPNEAVRGRVASELDRMRTSESP